jgi:hypothetical protein
MSAKVPSSHYREEGWPSDQENIAKLRFREAGVVSRLEEGKTTPSTPKLRRLRSIS